MRTEIIKCDRCGKELKYKPYEVNLPYMCAEEIYGYTIRGRELLKIYKYRCLDLIPQDLCKECMIKLVDWMNEVE